MSNLSYQNNSNNELTPQDRRRFLILKEEELRNQKKEIELRTQEINARNSRNKLIAIVAMIGFVSIAIIVAAVATVLISFNQNKNVGNEQNSAEVLSIEKTNEALSSTIQAFGITQTQAVIISSSKNDNIPAEIVKTNTPAPKDTPAPTAIPTPTITIQPVIAPDFYDNFDNGFADQWRTVEGSWLIVDGMAIPREKGGSIIVVGEPSWDNYALELDFETPEDKYGPGGGKLVILVGYKDKENYIYITLSALQNNYGYIQIYQMKKGDPYELVPSIYETYTDNERHRFRIEIQGNKANVLIDGKQVTNIALSESLKGSVGLRASSVSKPFVDNFRVSPLP